MSVSCYLSMLNILLDIMKTLCVFQAYIHLLYTGKYWAKFRDGLRQDFTESSQIEYRCNFQVSNINQVFEIRIESIRIQGGAFITLHFQYYKCKVMKAPPCTTAFSKHNSSWIQSNISDFSKSWVGSSPFRVESNNSKNNVVISCKNFWKSWFSLSKKVPFWIDYCSCEFCWWVFYFLMMSVFLR